MTGDPLFADGVDWGDIGIMGIKVLVAFAALLLATMFMIWFERKLISDMQHRIGPNVAGPWGLLQAFADGVKFFFKEDLRPANADPPRVPAGALHLGGHRVRRLRDRADRRRLHRYSGPQRHGHALRQGDHPAGGRSAGRHPAAARDVVGRCLRRDAGGLVLGSKYPLIGSVRASAQAISYEAALGMSVVAVVITAGTLSLTRS